MSFKAEIKTIGDPKWYDNTLRFATWGEAHDYGLDLGNRWSMVEEMRTVECTDAVNSVWADSKLGPYAPEEMAS